MTTVALHVKYYTFLSFIETRLTPSICSWDTLVNCVSVCKIKGKRSQKKKKTFSVAAQGLSVKFQNCIVVK